MNMPSIAAGALDGIVLLRYAHVFRDRISGGAEQYLWRLNRELLLRHAITIIQTHLVTADQGECEVEVERMGRGKILWVPLPIRRISRRPDRWLRSVGFVGRSALRLRTEGDAIRRDNWLHNLARGLRKPQRIHLRHRYAILSERLTSLVLEQRVNLVAMHWLSYDAERLLYYVLERKVPFVFINHFSNSRWLRKEFRLWIPKASGLAGVSDLCLPEQLRGNFTNLSDAVDAEFFNPANLPPASLSSKAVILLPARVIRGKGHADLIEAVAHFLHAIGSVELQFVGAVESPSLEPELRALAAAKGLLPDVKFYGEVNAGILRSLYHNCSMVVLPSASEGLGRVLLEAQAMGKPVIAYDAGGTRASMLPNETGFLVTSADVKQLSEKIRWISQHAVEAQRMGEQGRLFVLKHFTVDALVRRHERFYLDVLPRISEQRIRDREFHR